jgi:ppGpp synthetase/RelA/SpoT-type nucleotidyltranferase
MAIGVDQHDSEAYSRVKSLAEHACDHLKQRILQAVGALEDRNLVRARLADSRIKSHLSLIRKAQQHGWSFEESLSKAWDLVGLRLVCHNLQDVLRVANLLEDSLRLDGLTVKRHDYVTKPKPSGYRAIHLVFPMRVPQGGNEADLGCEIQIRSLLQDSWAELSHDDVYAGAVPPSIENRMKALSKLLARADATADRMRNDIARPRRGRRPISGQPLTDAAIAFLFREHFGDDPPDYLVRAVVRDTEGLGLRSDGIHAALADQSFIRRLQTAYEEASGWAAEPTQLFEWAVHSLSFGKDAAVRRATAEARTAWREIETIARRELLPDAISQIICLVEYPQKEEDYESKIEVWASALGASHRCESCGISIVDPEEFAAAAVKHYKVRGRSAASLRERLVEAVQSRTTEMGWWGTPSICSHCSSALNNAISKD